VRVRGPSPNYFEDIRKQNRIPTALVRVTPADGTQPRRVVDFAEETFSETKQWDSVYAVFDRDDHTTYATTNAKPVRFAAVPSIRCFQLWLLLHYADIQAFYHRARIFNLLRAHIHATREAWKKSMPRRNRYCLEPSCAPSTLLRDLHHSLLLIPARRA
jgi:hypothetical protein